MKTFEFIALSACIMTLTALGIDIMLPALGAVRQYFGLPPQSAVTSQIIVFFFLGQITQIIFGTLSDRLGRIAILRIGFPLYIVGGIVAALAPTLPVMLTARFVAGMGAAAVFMTTIAGVRDRFAGDAMARTMSLILTIFLFTPIFAPFLGMAILAVSSWQMVFLTPPIFAVIIFLWSLRLQESLPRERRVALNPRLIVKSIRQVLSDPVFVRYTGITTILFSGLSSYVASSERIVGEIYGRPSLFAWIFAGIGFLMSLCVLMNSRLSTRFGAQRSLKGLLIAYTVIASILLIYTLSSGDPPGMPLFFSGVALLMAINIAIEPNSSALALEPMGNLAGTAAAVYGTLFFFVGASMGSVISFLMVDGVMPLVISYFLIGIITTFLVLTDRRHLKKLSK